MRRLVIQSSLLLACAPRPAFAQVDPKITASLRSMKSVAEESVRLIKKAYSENATEYLLARKRYMLARSEVEALLGFMKQAMLTGAIDSIEANTYLKSGLASTQKASKDFFEFVDSALSTPSSKSAAAIAAVASIVAVALDIVKGWGAAVGVKASVTEERRKAIADLEKDLAWLPWPDVS